jgi:hypothetical protein
VPPQPPPLITALISDNKDRKREVDRQITRPTGLAACILVVRWREWQRTDIKDATLWPIKRFPYLLNSSRQKKVNSSAMLFVCLPRSCQMSSHAAPRSGIFVTGNDATYVLCVIISSRCSSDSACTHFKVHNNTYVLVTRKIAFFSISISKIPEAAGSAFSFQCNF